VESLESWNNQDVKDAVGVDCMTKDTCKMLSELTETNVNQAAAIFSIFMEKSYSNPTGKASFACCSYASNCNENTVEEIKKKQKELDSANSGSGVPSKMFISFTAYVLAVIFF